MPIKGDITRVKQKSNLKISIITGKNGLLSSFPNKTRKAAKHTLQNSKINVIEKVEVIEVQKNTLILSDKTKLKIDKSKIREVIGSGGKVIKDICEKSGAKVEIDDHGIITIFASKANDAKIAIDMINDIIAEPEVGKIYSVKVIKIYQKTCFTLRRRFVKACKKICKNM